MSSPAVIDATMLTLWRKSMLGRFIAEDKTVYLNRLSIIDEIAETLRKLS